MIWDILTGLLGVLLLIVLVSAALAPLESMGWYAGWFRVHATPVPADTEAAQPNNPRAAHFVVFLTGIASVSQQLNMPEEVRLLNLLRKHLPGAEIVDDIYPYSVTNRALSGQRLLSRLWRYVIRRKEQGQIVGMLVNMRNLFQVLVSADARYGPIYNRGSAQLVVDALLRHGYDIDSPAPVTLIGYSGGGQIALGAIPYIAAYLRRPVRMISLGGVFCSDPGLNHVEHFYHICGRQDGVQRLAARLSPQRWPVLRGSDWNRAVDEGRVTIVSMGDMKHTGPGGYLDEETRLENGDTHMEHTAKVIAALIRGANRRPAAAA